MARKCPNCNAIFKTTELDKLKYSMEAYKDPSKYVKCCGCGRFFVTNIIGSLLCLTIGVLAGIGSFVSSFFLDYPLLGVVLGVIGVGILLFRPQIHRYLPVIDVSETGL